MTTTIAWHVHHDRLLEPLTEPIGNRIAYIKANKSKHEVETRLRLLKPVKGRLPWEVVKAWEAYGKAWEAYVKTREAYGKAWEAYGKAWEAYGKAGEAYGKAWEAYGKAVLDHKDEIEALHREECPNCPWDGETIFPEKVE